MSPAAAAFASACNAPGLPTAVVVGSTDGAVVACAVAGLVAAVRLMRPHPASATAKTTATEARTIRLMFAVSRQAPETRLNALPTRPRPWSGGVAHAQPRPPRERADRRSRA